MKKIIISFFILFSIFFSANSFAEYGVDQIGPPEAPTKSGPTGNGLESPNYKINTSTLFGNTNKIKQTTSKATIDKGLEVIVEKLMIAFGVLSLLIMTIGGGYMIFAAGQDELLNKGKSIFNSGLIALLVALGSGIIMKLVIYLLY